MDSEKITESFDTKKHGWLNYLFLDMLFCQYLNVLPVFLLCKINVYDVFNMNAFFRFLLHRAILKFLSNQTCCWESMYKAPFINNINS